MEIPEGGGGGGSGGGSGGVTVRPLPPPLLGCDKSSSDAFDNCDTSDDPEMVRKIETPPSLEFFTAATMSSAADDRRRGIFKADRAVILDDALDIPSLLSDCSTIFLAASLAFSMS